MVDQNKENLSYLSEYVDDIQTKKLNFKALRANFANR